MRFSRGALATDGSWRTKTVVSTINEPRCIINIQETADVIISSRTILTTRYAMPAACADCRWC
jgi:hypothetical protein